MSQQVDQPPDFNPRQARGSMAWNQILEMMRANAQEAPGRSETDRAALSLVRFPPQMPNNNRPEPPSSPGVWGSNTSPHVFGGIPRESNAQEAPAEPEDRSTSSDRLERLLHPESLLNGSNNLGDVPASEHRRTGTNDPAHIPQALPQDSPDALLFSSVQESLESQQTLARLQVRFLNPRSPTLLTITFRQNGMPIPRLWTVCSIVIYTSQLMLSTSRPFPQRTSLTMKSAPSASFPTMMASM